MSDVSRKVVPDMGSLNRERPVAFIVRKKEFSIELEGSVREGVYTETR